MTDAVPPQSQYVQVRDTRVRRVGRQFIGGLALTMLALQLLSRTGALATLGLAGLESPGTITVGWLAVTVGAIAIGAGAAYGLWLGIARLTRSVFRDQAL